MAGFNEAGARTPDYGALDCLDWGHADDGFNEAGARTPDYGDDVHDQAGGEVDASMRPGREPRIMDGFPSACPADGDGFNEAGARTPDYGRRCRRDAGCPGRGFNEAGARTPDYGVRGLRGNTIDGATQLQ